MARYEVTLRINDTVTIEVEAENKEQAKELAVGCSATSLAICERADDLLTTVEEIEEV